jgi:hypothetical protein
MTISFQDGIMIVTDGRDWLRYVQHSIGTVGVWAANLWHDTPLSNCYKGR